MTPTYTLLGPGLERRMAYSRMHNQRRLNLTANPEESTQMSYEFLSGLTNVTVGLTNENLVKHSYVEVNMYGDNFCVICQEDISTNIYVNECISRVLSCSHCFHIQCIDTWFLRSKHCPTCKTEV